MQEKQSKLPYYLPMLASAREKPFNNDDFVYEIKLDGYRTISYVNNGKVKLESRNRVNFNNYYPIVEHLSLWNFDVILDGEIVVLNEKGVSKFSLLQNWKSDADGELVYYVFDILWHKGKDVTKIPLSERKSILKELPFDNIIRLSYDFNDGIELFKYAVNLDLEGIIAKNRNSFYVPELRSKCWIKIKVRRVKEFIIIGYLPKGRYFHSILIGYLENKKIIYSGRVAVGFSYRLKTEMMEFFKLLISKPAFLVSDSKDLKKSKPIWIKPTLMCNVAFSDITNRGLLRHASFKGITRVQ